MNRLIISQCPQCGHYNQQVVYSCGSVCAVELDCENCRSSWSEDPVDAAECAGDR